MIPIPIEKHVPLPAARATSKYPLRQMAIGESFVVPRGEAKAVNSAIASVRHYQKRSGYPVVNFTQRRELDSELTRFWRTE